MRVRIREAKVVDPRSPFDGKVVDLLIENGKSSKITASPAQTAKPDKSPTAKPDTSQSAKPTNTAKSEADNAIDKIIEIKGLHVSPGWVDIFAQFHDPGQEHKETIETGTAAAAQGGFTEVMTVPNTNPAISTKSMVEYAKRPGVHPIGAVSKNLEGKDLAEMYDMHAGGAKAFSDGWKPIQSGGLMVKALQYLKTIDGTLIQVPEDQSVSAHGLMHEGIVSTRMGLKGQPILAEEIMVERDLKLLEYTGSSLHFTGITSEKSIEAIEAAKKKGLKVTCSTTPYHITFCDEDLEGYNTNLKLNPPLRDRKSMMALRQAVKDGKVDVITSQHLPQDWDSKECEFEYAKPGAIGLECAYGALNEATGITASQTVTLLSINPRKIFHLESAEIKEGHPANLTLFLPEGTYTFEKEMLKSKSRNCPYLGKTLKGKIIGTILHSQLNLV